MKGEVIPAKSGGLVDLAVEKEAFRKPIDSSLWSCDERIQEVTLPAEIFISHLKYRPFYYP
jgi:hypothetical protein